MNIPEVFHELSTSNLGGDQNLDVGRFLGADLPNMGVLDTVAFRFKHSDGCVELSGADSKNRFNTRAEINILMLVDRVLNEVRSCSGCVLSSIRIRLQVVTDGRLGESELLTDRNIRKVLLLQLETTSHLFRLALIGSHGLGRSELRSGHVESLGDLRFREALLLEVSDHTLEGYGALVLVLTGSPRIPARPTKNTIVGEFLSQCCPP